MRKRTLARILVVLVMGALVTAVVLAAPKANIRKGKVYYKKYCRTCHDGSTDQKELHPITKTMSQWDRMFQPGKVVSECQGRSLEKTGMDLSEQDLLDIQGYLIYHAADSDHPATCGKQ